MTSWRRFLPLLILVVLGAAASLPCRASSVDDYQAWLGVNTIFWKQDRWNLSVWTEARFQDDLTRSLGYFVGPGTRFRAHPNLDLDFAIRFILFNVEPENLELVRYQLAVTPHWKLFGNSRMALRNRVEWITRQGDNIRTRIRHRLQWSWPIEGRRRLKSFYMSEEIFWNWSDRDDWDVNQSRFVPVGLSWQAHENMRVSTYYMMQYIQAAGAHNHALGVTAIWNLTH